MHLRFYEIFVEILLASSHGALMDSLGEVVFIKSNMNFGDFIDDQWAEKNTGRYSLTEFVKLQ